MTLNEWIEALQKKGRLTFTKEEALQSLGLVDSSFRIGISRLSKKKRVMKIANGLYVAIPLNYQTGKGLPPTLYIDQLMRFHKLPYYVGLLSAATYHGSTHQAVQELQVVTSKSLRPIKISNVKIRFFTKKNLSDMPTQRVNVTSGQITVATPESTAIDLVVFMNKCGGLNHIATVLLEMKDFLRPKELLNLCKKMSDHSVVQRLGYLLEQIGEKENSKKIHIWLQNKVSSFAKLDPRSPLKNKKNDSWKIFVNADVEPDEI